MQVINSICRNILAASIAVSISLPVVTLAASASGSCSVTSNLISFGNYDVYKTAPTDTSTSIQVRCLPPSVTYNVALDNGLYGSIQNRLMRNADGHGNMKYNLYTDATYSTIWGDGTGGGVSVQGQGNQKFTVYGRIPPLQNVWVGSYSDVVTITVNF